MDTVKKIDPRKYSRADLCDYALKYFGVVINRKLPLAHVRKSFTVHQKTYLEEKKLQEDQKVVENEMRKEVVEKLIEKEEVKIQTKMHYPHKIKDEDGETSMYRPCPGAICLGDPPTRQVIDGEAKTESMPISS